MLTSYRCVDESAVAKHIHRARWMSCWKSTLAVIVERVPKSWTLGAETSFPSVARWISRLRQAGRGGGEGRGGGRSCYHTAAPGPQTGWDRDVCQTHKRTEPETHIHKSESGAGEYTDRHTGNCICLSIPLLVLKVIVAVLSFLLPSLFISLSLPPPPCPLPLFFYLTPCTLPLSFCHTASYFPSFAASSTFSDSRRLSLLTLFIYFLLHELHQGVICMLLFIGGTNLSFCTNLHQGINEVIWSCIRRYWHKGVLSLEFSYLKEETEQSWGLTKSSNHHVKIWFDPTCLLSSCKLSY